MGTELTVTGWFLSPIIREMQDTALSYIRGQFSWEKDQERDLERLDTMLTEILAIVDVIEKREIKDGNQRKLLRKLKDAIYGAVDVLDSFEYMALKAKIDRQATLLPVTHARVTSPLKEENHTYGREDELDKLRGLLLLPSDSSASGPSNSCVPVISIIGVGGVGKTSLAQLAFRDEQIRANFGLRIWVCVSDIYDETRLTRDILESVTNENYRSVTVFDELRNILREKISQNNFLLVLDDVWYDESRTDWENESVWYEVLSTLNTGLEGSKILVTTRSNKASELLHAGASLPLGGLNRDDYWMLFKSYAFGEKHPGLFKELKEIGMQIAERLNGLPLSAKVIGRLLNVDLDSSHWKKVLASDISDDVMKVLRLSYQHLPIHLQLCFSFCSLFPKNWRFDPKRLTDMWISQGFVQKEDGSDNDMNIEDIANGYFNDLVQRSFFERTLLNLPTEYVMHDLMNDLARNVSKDEYARIESEKQKVIPPNIRHLSISANLLDGMNKAEMKNLRTLLVWSKSWPCLELSLPNNVFKKSKYIRVLDLTGCCLEMLPTSVKKLKHLRYLAFRVPAKPLPTSLVQLYHLEVLFTRGHSCRGSECVQLPRNMKKNLLKLRKAYLFNLGGGTISGFGEQTILHGPGEFHVKKESGHRLGELKEMNNIRGRLSVRFLENVENQQQAVDAHLDRKQHVQHLQLEWSDLPRPVTPELDSDVLEALRPHRDLDRLNITGYKGARSPSWFATNWMRALTYVVLDNCVGWVQLPPLGQLPLLKDLVLRNMLAVRQIDQEFYGNGDTKGFPKLEEIVFDGMPNWEKWSGIEDGSLLPYLARLHIAKCPKLQESPPLNARPKIEVKITSDSIPSSCLFDSLITSASYLVLIVNCCSFLSSLSADQLSHVEELNVKNCTDPMPACGFVGLSSLKMLRISDCSALLVSVSAEADEDHDTCFFPRSLCHLEIVNCNIQSSLLPRYLQGLVNLSTLMIFSCDSLDLLSLSYGPHHLTALDTIIIKECHYLASMDGFENLIALRKLVVAECNSFCSLPADLNAVRYLNTLIIYGCPEMEFLPQNGIPASVQKILLSRLHPELDKQLQRKDGTEWHKIYHVPEKKLERYFAHCGH
uniref:NB-ARC domain-containing protein n=1 Tax=Leersia perrieri TaxID=77586 RepID=A0A0D9WS63_9ORYZ